MFFKRNINIIFLLLWVGEKNVWFYKEEVFILKKQKRKEKEKESNKKRKNGKKKGKKKRKEIEGR